MDLFEGSLWPHFSWMSQEFSRLSSIGAPSRPVHLILSPIYTALVVAFGVGVWRSAGRRRAVRVIGGAFVVYGLVSLVWPQFFPENLSQPVSAMTNTMHMVLTAVTVLSWMVILGFAIPTFGKWFAGYSILTLLTIIVCGALLGPQVAALASGQPTPWIGLTERINIYGFYVWMSVLAIILSGKLSQAESL